MTVLALLDIAACLSFISYKAGYHRAVMRLARDDAKLRHPAYRHKDVS